MEEKIKVLIKTNENNEIIAIRSSVFVDASGYIVIDEGTSDKYVHAQNNYLEKPLMDEHCRFNYQYIDTVVSEIIHRDYIA